MTTIRLRPALSKYRLNVAKNGGPFVGVEFHDLTDQNGGRVARAGIGRIQVSGNPIRPGDKRLEVQPVKFSQVEEHDGVGLLDLAALNLGQVGVGPTDASFDVPKRELVVHAGAPQDSANLWAVLPVGEIRLGGSPRSR